MNDVDTQYDTRVLTGISSVGVLLGVIIVADAVYEMCATGTATYSAEQWGKQVHEFLLSQTM